jgi:hypothetical protein
MELKGSANSSSHQLHIPERSAIDAPDSADLPTAERNQLRTEFLCLQARNDFSIAWRSLDGKWCERVLAWLGCERVLAWLG